MGLGGWLSKYRIIILVSIKRPANSEKHKNERMTLCNWWTLIWFHLRMWRFDEIAVQALKIPINYDTLQTCFHHDFWDINANWIVLSACTINEQPVTRLKSAGYMNLAHLTKRGQVGGWPWRAQLFAHWISKRKSKMAILSGTLPVIGETLLELHLWHTFSGGWVKLEIGLRAPGAKLLLPVLWWSKKHQNYTVKIGCNDNVL